MRLEFEPENESDLAEPPDVSALLWVLSILPPRVGRALQESAALGVFEALASGPISNEALAARCGLAPNAVPPLTHALINTRYVRKRGEGFELTDFGRRWLLGLNQGGFADFVRACGLAAGWQNELPAFLETGAPVPGWPALTNEARASYQRGQQALAKAREADLLANLVVPAGARKLLDVGAAHGARAAALCRRFPDLSGVVLDTPDAVEASAGLLPSELASRLAHRAVDPHPPELGTEPFDLILISFPPGSSASQNAELIRRAARALKPGGTLAVDDFLPPADAAQLGQQAAVHALSLTMTRAEGPFTIDEVVGWQRAAGLEPLPAVATLGNLSTLQQAIKPRAAGAAR